MIYQTAKSNFINRQLAEKSLYHYVQYGWQHIEPAPFQNNWHIKFICDHLQAFFLNVLPHDYLLINIPPGLGKSLLTSVFLPSWMWIRYPDTRFLTGSKTEELAIRDARRARSLMTSDWYQQSWGANNKIETLKWVFADDENRKRGYENDKRGYRNIFSRLSNVTGKRGYNIIDDLNDASETYNLNSLRETNIWYGGVLSTRVNILERSKTAIIQQRIAKGDFSEYILDALGDKVLHICLPFEFDSSKRCVTPLGQDPRTEDGEYLWKAIPTSFIEDRKLFLNRRYAAQYQQVPAPLEGAIFKNSDFHYYKKSELPERFDRIIDSTDVAEKTGKTNDYSVISVWGILGNKKYLLDLWRGRLEYPDLKKKHEMMGEKWKPNQRLIEDKSSGTPLLQDLKIGTKYPILAIKPKGAKEARADAVRPEFQMGNVLFPESEPWLNDYIEEMLLFPNSDHDDQVDTTTQFLIYVSDKTNRNPSIRRL